MSTAHDTDESLLLSGDLEDFGRFYDRYVRALLGFFQRRTGDPETAADLTAETFAAALVARRRYRPQSDTAAAWLFGIAHHKLSDYRRRGRSKACWTRTSLTTPSPTTRRDASRSFGFRAAASMRRSLPPSSSSSS